jgi:hypothetical protein
VDNSFQRRGRRCFLSGLRRATIFRFRPAFQFFFRLAYYQSTRRQKRKLKSGPKSKNQPLYTGAKGRAAYQRRTDISKKLQYTNNLTWYKNCARAFLPCNKKAPQVSGAFCLKSFTTS